VLVTKAPDTVRDAKEVGKAIAFELATAVGIHTTDGLRFAGRLQSATADLRGSTNLDGPARVRGRKPHPEQIWPALPQIADINFIGEDFSVGPEGDIADAPQLSPTTSSIELPSCEVAS
jgi:hypothetical protein